MLPAPIAPARWLATRTGSPPPSSWPIEPADHAAHRFTGHRFTARLIAALLLAGAAPQALAQPQPAPSPAPAADPDGARLRELIPDAALADPEGWARSAATGAVPAIIANPPELHPDLPPADWPGFTLAWPDPAAAPAPLAALPPEPGLPTATPEELVPNRAGAQYAFAGGHLALAWAPGDPPPSARAALESRFRPLSALLSLSGKEAAGLGQVAVRAATDRDLLLRMLRTEGYYDAEVDQALAAAPASAAPGPGAPPSAIAVRFDLLPGTRYRFGKVALPGLEAAGADAAELRAAFPVASGDPVISGAVVEARATLDTALGEGGYPFARVAEGELVVDHRSEQADLSVPVTPGGKYRFGTLTSNLPRFLSSRHLADIARFHPGDPYRRSEVDDLRRAILATGLVSSVTVTPREAQAPAAGQPGTVGLDVALAPAPLRTVAGAVGYDTGDGFRLEASWEHRNLVPPEGMLRLRAVAGTNEQLAGATLRQNNFLGRDRALTVDIYADNANRSAYAARKLAFATTFERLTTLLFQKPWTWSMSLEVEASAEREGVPSGITTGRTNYLTVALPLRVAFDTSDDLLDPTRGWRLSARASPETAYSHGQWATYAKLQFDGSAYLPLADRVVLAGRVRLGSIPGAALSQIAPSRRFYAGGGGSVRGYGYQLIGPRNSNGDITGGRSLYEASVEARIKTGLFAGTLSLAPFLDAGGVDNGDVPGFHDTRFGAGVGLRWQTGFGPLRVDLGTPIGRRPGESVIGVYVALGQSF